MLRLQSIVALATLALVPAFVRCAPSPQTVNSFTGAGSEPKVDLSSTYTNFKDIFAHSRPAKSAGFRTAAAAAPLNEPPSGFSLVFGPIGAAVNAPGYMGYVSLDTYDVNGCASACVSRGVDGKGGGCKFFNIWQGTLLATNQTTFTCAMYFLPTDSSTATNTGDATVSVSMSRGYKRTSFLPDGTFEGFNCPAGQASCSTQSFGGWVGTSEVGTDSATIFQNTNLAHLGKDFVLLGSAGGTTSTSGNMTANTISTVPGTNYVLQFFHFSDFNGGIQEGNAFVDVIWNGKVVQSFRPGASQWKFFQVPVIAQGSDVLVFRGGAFPSYDFLDDVYLFQS